MSTAVQIIAEHRWSALTDACACGDPTITWGAHPAHVVAALTNAGKAIVDPKAFDLAIWLHLGGECDDAPEPNYEEDNYDAGFIAGIAHAQKTIRAQLPELLAAARVAERGEATS